MTHRDNPLCSCQTCIVFCHCRRFVVCIVKVVLSVSSVLLLHLPIFCFMTGIMGKLCSLFLQCSCATDIGFSHRLPHINQLIAYSVMNGLGCCCRHMPRAAPSCSPCSHLKGSHQPKWAVTLFQLWQRLTSPLMHSSSTNTIGNIHVRHPHIPVYHYILHCIQQ